MKVINHEAHKRIIEILYSCSEEAGAIYDIEGNRSGYASNGSLISMNCNEVHSHDIKAIADGWLIIDSICEIVMNTEGMSEEVFAKHIMDCEYITEKTYDGCGYVVYAVPLENFVDFMLKCDHELNVMREIIPSELYQNIDVLRQIIDECEDID